MCQHLYLSPRTWGGVFIVSLGCSSWFTDICHYRLFLMLSSSLLPSCSRCKLFGFILPSSLSVPLLTTCISAGHLYCVPPYAIYSRHHMSLRNLKVKRINTNLKFKLFTMSWTKQKQKPQNPLSLTQDLSRYLIQIEIPLQPTHSSPCQSAVRGDHVIQDTDKS